MNKKKTNQFFNFKALISILISIIGIWLGFRKFDPNEFLSALQQTNLFYFFLAMAVIILTIILRAWRWKYLVHPLKNMPMNQLFAATSICYFGNNVFPMRLGEILRSYSLGKMGNISAVAIFGTVVNERVLDSLVFFIIILFGAIFLQDMPSWVQTGGITGGIILILFSIFLLIFNKSKNKFKIIWYDKTKKYNDHKLFKIFSNLLKGILSLKNTPHLLLIIFQSIIIWLVSISVFWIIGLALNEIFSLQSILLIFLVTSAVIAVPAAPGYIGTYHAGAISILLYLGLSTPKAQAMAVIMHGVGFISLTLLGLFYFLKYHIHINETSNIDFDQK